MPRISAVILAAGLSSRLGVHKPLVALGGASLLERVAGLFSAMGVTDVIAVAGCRDQETAAEAERLSGLGMPLRCVRNERFAEGMFSSVAAGLAALPSGCDAFFVLPVDIPLVRRQTLRWLLEGLAAHGRDDRPAVLYPVFGGLRGHPPLLDARLAPPVLAHPGAGGLAGALAELEAGGAAVALDVPVADANIHFDVDTPQDLLAARRRVERLDIPAPAEAEALLMRFGAGERGLGHGRGVARAALALARALNARGANLDLELTEAAGLLHDIAKGAAGHEQVGATLLEGLGFAPLARIVAAHRDIAPQDSPEITERELVYLADKLVRGSARVPVAQRFQEKLDAFADDPEVAAAIRRRLTNALAMQARVEAAAGADIESILKGEL
jgi:CTP:molybdopterin cytidylyltransferase MocA